MAPRWATPHRPPVYHGPERPAAHARGSALVHLGLPEDLSSPSGAGAAVRDGPEHSPAVDSWPLGGAAGDAAHAGGCPHPVLDGAGEAPRGGRSGSDGAGRTDEGAAPPSGATRTGPRPPPCGHDGTERRIARPHDPTEQTRYYRGKKTCQTVKHVLLINAALTILLLSATYAGSTHDKRIADATPYPLPAGNRLLQDLGFMAFTLNQVETLMPTRKPRGRALTRAQKAANRRIARRARAHCARQQPRQALSHRPPHQPPAEGGRP